MCTTSTLHRRSVHSLLSRSCDFSNCAVIVVQLICRRFLTIDAQAAIANIYSIDTDGQTVDFHLIGIDKWPAHDASEICHWNSVTTQTFALTICLQMSIWQCFRLDDDDEWLFRCASHR